MQSAARLFSSANMSSVRKYQPHYTVSDYQHWEGDWELWYGTAVAMSPSPFGPHERAVSSFAYMIQSSIQLNQCPCKVYTGLDWIIQEDTVVRPDVMLVCGCQPERHLETPPILVVEVLSESTATKDRLAKRELYERQGVEDYLIVDTAARTICWLELQTNGTYQDATNKIAENGLFSISLSNGCIVNFDRNAGFS